jgi:hypothetical protein
VTRRPAPGVGDTGQQVMRPSSTGSAAVGEDLRPPRCWPTAISFSEHRHHLRDRFARRPESWT